MAYFIRQGANTFLATPETGGAWNPEEQHIAPMIGLLTHLTELDHKQRDEEAALVPGRMSVEILGVLGYEPFDVEVEVVRPGRTIELVEAVCIQNGRPAVRMRTWFMAQTDTSAIAGTAFSSIPGPTAEKSFPGLGTNWSGGFVESINGYRKPGELGRGFAWWQTDTKLIESEPVSNLAAFMGLMDMTNGIVVRKDPSEVIYPNLDLTAHLFRMPEGKWLGADVSVSFGANGIGETHSVIHDENGPVGTCSQILTVRPRT
ncbi:thioesterase family protein [Corynebacterium stationis]|uniref:thioesterase family protein n=1 Tax=Corynebacterium stationis TaxID=1705 RepID=UPI00076F662D|nr:thioesterase family protein [Corynebacterium stationis]AMJ44765.1 hypothetical protein AW169_07570 [Corynebacterium stationis]AQX71221.1 hypothetical protein CA21670_06755 [Corynebacterium stationis]ASJ18908.1 hypothetical protein BA700_07565 [Corynebacterium stationis]HJG63250.1 thioesterase family protein [Corynebacterium stationis]